ncbi:MAG: dihydrodipicolinate synthase family protein [Aristaeellaceae bacterium]
MQLNNIEGLWPVMITPFTDEGEIDYASLEKLIDWYERHGAAGLFAACQSSEIFCLSLREREQLVSFVKSHARIPVIASGHISDGLTDQAEELTRMHKAGADALILITNRLCAPHEDSQTFMRHLQQLMKALPPEVPLGFYECPYPYKRLITLDELRWCAQSGRFLFMKDTCCDAKLIADRVQVLAGSPLKLFNANTTTFLSSLQAGAAGFSGVMLNFHPELYGWLLRHWRDQPEKAEQVQSFLTMFSLIERQAYPVNAKYHLMQLEGVLGSTHTRTKPKEIMTDTFRLEVRQMAEAADAILKHLNEE